MARTDIGPVRRAILRGLVLLPGLCVVLIVVVVALCVFWPAATEYR